jgi:putative transposase
VRQSFKFTFFKAKRLKHLHRTIDLSAQIWNHCVALHRRYYKLFGKGLCEGKLKAHLAKLRNGRFSHWKAVGSQSVQAIVERLYLVPRLGFSWERGRFSGALFRGNWHVGYGVI